MNKLITVFLVLVMLNNALDAQSFYSRRRDRTLRYQFGLNLTFIPDQGISSLTPVPGVHTGFEKKLGSQISSGLGIFYSRLAYKQNAISFSNQLLGLSLYFKFNIIPVNGSFTRRPVLNPFILGGFRTSSNRPKTDWEGTQFDLRNLGNGLVSERKNTQGWFTGLGVDLKATPYIDLIIEGTYEQDFGNSLHVQYDPQATPSTLPLTNPAKSDYYLSFRIGISLHLPSNFFPLGFTIDTVSKYYTKDDHNLSDPFTEYLYDLTFLRAPVKVSQTPKSWPHMLLLPDSEFIEDSFINRIEESSPGDSIIDMRLYQITEEGNTELEINSFDYDDSPDAKYVRFITKRGTLRPQISFILKTVVRTSSSYVNRYSSDTLDMTVNFSYQLFQAGSDYQKILDIWSIRSLSTVLDSINSGYIEAQPLNTALVNYLSGQYEKSILILEDLIIKSPYDWQNHYLLAQNQLKGKISDYGASHIERAYILNDSLFQKRNFDNYLFELKASAPKKYDSLQRVYSDVSIHSYLDKAREVIVFDILEKEDLKPSEYSFLESSFEETQNPIFLFYMAALHEKQRKYAEAKSQLYQLLSHPNSSYALKKDARLKLANIFQAANKNPSIEKLSKEKAGKYSALLLIGTDTLNEKTNRDAALLKGILEEEYSFSEVKILKGLTLAQFKKGLRQYADQQPANSSLLIVSFLNGGIHELTQQSYWEFADITENNKYSPTGGYLSHSTLFSDLNYNNLESKNLLIVSKTHISNTTKLAEHEDSHYSNLGQLTLLSSRLALSSQSDKTDVIGWLIEQLINTRNNVFSLREIHEVNKIPAITYRKFIELNPDKHINTLGDFIFLKRY